MNDHTLSRQRRRELLITLSYTIFSVLMITVTPIENWPIFYIPLIAAELAFIWWSYATGFENYLFRSFIVTVMICLNVLLYGIQAENFYVLIPTLCVEFVLLSLYEMVRIMDVAVLQTLFLFAYHTWIRKDFVMPTASTGRNRIMLWLVSFVVLIVLCIYRIHHHVQEEQDVEDLEAEVRREKKIKDDFMANTSHELRTPVNTISGMCEILLQKTLPDDIHRNVLDIQITGAELQDIVTDIMDYAALEGDVLELSPRAYNITSTLNDVMNMTVFEMRDKKLEVIFDCDPNIPCLLEGDEQQLRRVLNNLVSNAIKFTSEGGVIVRVTYRPEEYGINLIVSVRDTGVGMDLDEQERVLRGFYQSDSDRSRKNSGMGLGLTISSALIKKMGGFLTIRSEVGSGSEFSFAIPQKVLNEQPCISLLHPGSIRLIWFCNPQTQILPMREAFMENINHFSEYFGIYGKRATSFEECKRRVAQGQGVHLVLGQNEYMENQAYFDALSETIPVILIADHDAPVSAAPRMHILYNPYNAIMLAEILNGREQTTAVRKKERKKFIAPSAKILAVDDNLMNLKVVEGLLRKYRIKIVAASSGEEALSLIESRDFDFVFMDHMMPGMDGVECFHRIREKNGTYYSQVPIIALTANAITGSREMFLSEGFNEFVAKPIDTSLLHDVLQRFIPLEKQIYEEDIVSAEPQKAEETAPKAAAKAAETPAQPKAEAVPSAPEAPVPSASASEISIDDLEGIDKETALLYCGSVEDMKELALVYCESGKAYENDLKTAAAAEDMENYALLAHTVKSTSKTLGAMHLSELALKQEMGAKGNQKEEVLERHDEFIAEYHRVLEMLRKFIGEKPAEAAAPKKKSSSEIPDKDALFAELRQCLEAYETKLFEDRLAEYSGQTLSGRPLDEVFAGVLKKASNFDFDGAIAELNEIGGEA